MENTVDYSYKNAQNVLNKLEVMIDRGFSRNMREVYHDLSIFDWWTERLSVTQMKQMRTFLKLAISLGYTGCVSFKVGASGCANGMWAHKAESTNGYDPDGPRIYRSFTPDYTYYQICDENNQWFPKDDEYDSIKTPAQLKKLISSLNL